MQTLIWFQSRTSEEKLKHSLVWLFHASLLAKQDRFQIASDPQGVEDQACFCY